MTQQSHYWVHTLKNHKWKRHMYPIFTTVNNSQDMEAIEVLINRGMDKEDMLRMYNGILLSHKEEWNSAICRDVDGPRDCHTEPRKSEKEKQIFRNMAYMWNLEKWYRWTYLQSRNRDTDNREQTMDTKEGRGGRMNWDWYIHIYTIMCIYT